MLLKRRRWSPASLLAVAVCTGCYDFHLEGPEDPSPLPLPRTVSVSVEYRQPDLCTTAPERCGGPVVFYGSWMRPGQELVLRPAPGLFVWVGRLSAVPVNYPPHGRAHTVRVFDPYLAGTGTSGFTGRRLTVGGETLTRVEFFGSRDEYALVYVDDNGFGHNPF